MILENWLQFECSKEGEQSEQAKYVRTKMPKRVKKRRKVGESDEDGWEEYYDYLFPDDQAQARNIRILENAHKWKKDESATSAQK